MVQVPLKDYAYANARVRAMTARLLDESTWSRLLSAPDYNHFLSELDETEYGPYVEQALLEGIQVTQVDRAFNRVLTDDFNKIKDFFEGRPRELVCAVLSRWDLYNLKTILRGKQAIVPNSEIVRNLVPIGYLDNVALEEIANQPDLRAAIDFIAAFSRGWRVKYGNALMSRLREYYHDHDLAVLESAMDQEHYRDMVEAVKGGDSSSRKAQRILGLEIDVINHVTLLRVSGMGLDREQLARYYLPGGGMDFREFQRLARCKDEEELVGALPGRDELKPPLQRALAQLDEKGYAAFQDELDRYQLQQALRLDDNPLDLGVIIRYMWLKWVEVTNLRIAMRGKTIGMIESQIRKEMLDIAGRGEARAG